MQAVYTIKNNTHPIDACLAGLELKLFMTQIKELQDSLGFASWDLRIGIHWEYGLLA